VNYNYYDRPDLLKDVHSFLVKSLKQQIALGMKTSNCLVLGKKNADILKKINKEEKLFEEVNWIEHPRYIQQYKMKQREEYIGKYLEALKKLKK
jgi:hypothetical protein